MNRFIISLLFTYIFASSCATAKNKKKQPVDTRPATVSFNIDTVASSITLVPEDGYNIHTTSVNVVVADIKQSNAILTIKKIDGTKSIHYLPFMPNDNGATFGGFMQYNIAAGEEAEVSATDIEKGIPVKAKILITGYKQLIKK